MAVKTDVRVALVAMTALLSAMLATACQPKPRGDAELAAAFRANQQWFAQLTAAYASGHVSCSGRWNLDDCLLGSSQNAIAHLRDDARVQSVNVKRNRAGVVGIWLPVESYGALTVGASRRGYVYLPSPPSALVTNTVTALVANTLATGRTGSYYKPLSGGWYLFVGN